MWQAIEAEMEKEREQAEALALIERKKQKCVQGSATSSRNNAKCSGNSRYQEAKKNPTLTRN